MLETESVSTDHGNIYSESVVMRRQQHPSLSWLLKMKAEQREQPLVSFMWIFKNFFEFTVMSSFMGTSTNSDSYV